MLQTFKNIMSSIKNGLLFLTELLDKENGIRSLYIMILLVPSICLLLLYNSERKTNSNLESQIKTLQVESNKNYKLYVTAKDSLRATLFKEYIELAKAMNDLQKSLNSSNDEKSKEILNYSNKVNEELNKIN